MNLILLLPNHFHKPIVNYMNIYLIINLSTVLALNEKSKSEATLNEIEKCEIDTICESCTLHSNCVWCPLENSCVEGDFDGPTDEPCNSYDYGQCSTIDCDAFTDCNSCLNAPDCGWCGSITECLDLDLDEDCAELYTVNTSDLSICPEEDISTGIESENRLSELEFSTNNIKGSLEVEQEEMGLFVDFL